MPNSGPLTIKDFEAAMAAITKNYGAPPQYLLPSTIRFLKPLFQEVRCIFDGKVRHIPTPDLYNIPFQYHYMPLDFYQPRWNKRICITGI